MPAAQNFMVRITTIFFSKRLRSSFSFHANAATPHIAELILGCPSKKGAKFYKLARSILCKILTTLMMMMWWVSSSIKHQSNHLSLTFKLIILLRSSSQQHHNHVVCDCLGEEEGEEEYGNGSGCNQGCNGSRVLRGEYFNYFSQHDHHPHHARLSNSPLIYICQIYPAHNRCQYFIVIPAFIPMQLSFVTISG